MDGSRTLNGASRRHGHHGLLLTPVVSFTTGSSRLYTRNAAIRISRPVSSVWEAWTSRNFWKCFFSYDFFEGEFCPASAFFAKGSRDDGEFREHGQFSVIREGLVLRYHVWHWGKDPNQDSDSTITVTFKELGDGSTKIHVLQIWRLADGETDAAFDWNTRLEHIRLFLENICA